MIFILKGNSFWNAEHVSGAALLSKRAVNSSFDMQIRKKSEDVAVFAL
jgi:hypothetical protein